MSDLTPDPSLSADEQRIWQLHRQFVVAGTEGDHPFLQDNMVSGGKLIWYNLNKSNYYGLDHIIELWKTLTAAAPGGRATATPREEEVTVAGDMALVTYLFEFKADFGDMGKVEHQARNTEVWQRIQGDWKMIHYHCSDHEPGIMGGR